MSEVKEFTVKRSKWLRGCKDGDGMPADSCLLDYEGHMCCLGFYAQALGVKAQERLNAADPAECHSFAQKAPWLAKYHSDEEWYVNTSKADLLMEQNDSMMLKDPEREKIIKRMFAEEGITVKFVD